MFDWLAEVLRTPLRGEDVRMANAFILSCTWRRGSPHWGTTFASVASMGERAGMTRNNAQRAMRRLEDAGLIVRRGCKRCGQACAGGRSGHPTIRVAAIEGYAIEQPGGRQAKQSKPNATPCGHDPDALRPDGTCRVCEAL